MPNFAKMENGTNMVLNVVRSGCDQLAQTFRENNEFSVEVRCTSLVIQMAILTLLELMARKFLAFRENANFEGQK